MRKIADLKTIMKEKKFISVVGAHNALTAKLVEETGFEGVWASGCEISTSYAVPDANILTMNDFLRAASQMTDAVSIPVIADCDTGFGNSNNVIRMIKKYESAGIAAVCIEDKQFPKVNSFIPGRQELAPIAEFVGKIMAAKNAQSNKQFLVFARVEALIAGWGMEEALRRAEAYQEAGADGIFIHSKEKSPHEIIEFCERWNKRIPVIISPTTYSLSEKQMQRLGVSIVIYANQGMRASIKYVKEIFTRMKKQGTRGLSAKIVSMDELFRLQGMHLMKSDEKKYLKTGLGSLKAIIPAAGGRIDDSLKPLLEDRPVCMLDINGKSLLQRNVDSITQSGIKDINVIVGYKADHVSVEGAHIIHNQQYRHKGIMHSIMSGSEPVADKNIIIYSDIVLDQHLLQRLLKQDSDIVLIVDGSYKKMYSRNKKLELVITKFPLSDSLRVIDTNKVNPIIKISKHLAEEEAHAEFIGVASLSRRGMKVLEAELKKGRLLEPVSFADLMQHIIDRGHAVMAYEISGGWIEVHTFQDYKRASAVFS